MKKLAILLLSLALALSAAACGRQEAPEVPEAPQSPPEPVVLGVDDLLAVLGAIDLTEATLTYHSELKEEGSYPAAAAIRAADYLVQLQGFTWAEALPPAEWNGDERQHYVLTAPGVSLTAYQYYTEEGRLLRLLREEDAAEGMFLLPHAEGGEDEAAQQYGWMLTELFYNWYTEAETASLYGTGNPLTAEELDTFTDYTASVYTEYVPERDMYHSGSLEISCFFTSRYDDVRELNFEEFMLYFPGDRNDPQVVSDEEFEALKRVENWPFDWVEERDNMPVPIHKYPRSRVDAVLTKYAGITTAELLDLRGVAYLEAYDAFYNYTSDFGPGMFTPRYGERNGDTVTLWGTPAHDGSCGMLTLKKSGENWHILSHKLANS